MEQSATMYEGFFELHEKPFSLLPDPGFFYSSRKHQEALTLLEYGLLNQAGFIILTGEIGSGKTTLMRRLVEGLDKDVVIGLISNTHQSLGNMMEWIGQAFDLKAGTGGNLDLHRAFVDFLIQQYSAGKRVLLIVDEAQNLGVDRLEELRLLSNINADKDLVLQLMLLGQPQLRELLRRPELEQFVQRVAASYHLGALDAAETEQYIYHRIRVSGGRYKIFDKAACRRLHHYSKGIPRLINLFCDTALVYAYGAARRVITGADIEELIEVHARHLLISIELDAGDRGVSEASLEFVDLATEDAIESPPAMDRDVRTGVWPGSVSGAESAAPAIGDSEQAWPEPPCPADSNGVAASRVEGAKADYGEQLPPLPATISDRDIGARPRAGVEPFTSTAPLLQADDVSLSAGESSSGDALPSASSSMPEPATDRATWLGDADASPAARDRHGPGRMVWALATIPVAIAVGVAVAWYMGSGTSDGSRERLSEVFGWPRPPAESGASPDSSGDGLVADSGLDLQESVPAGRAPGQGQLQGQGYPDPDSASSRGSATPGPDDNQTAGPPEQDVSVVVQSTETASSDAPEERVAPTVEPLTGLPETSAPVQAAEIPPPTMKADEAVVADATPPAVAESISELERRLRALPVEVATLSSGHFKLDLGETVQFSGGDTTLSAGARTILADLVEVLRDSETAMVTVIGHTDSSGPEWVNDNLSTRRAASVARFLALGGIPSDRLSSEGRGKRELKIDAEQEQRLGPGINRRIEIEVRTSDVGPE
ncbi:MAG: hypothetical protein EOM22_13055 [Gammaproteobacteria bacterium]|nr:hypothetical protein [Gammaproteobacteria bacterium]